MAFGGARGRSLAAVEAGGDARGLTEGEPGFPGHLDALIVGGTSALHAAHDVPRAGAVMGPATAEVLPPIAHPGKIIRVGLNYADHSAESGFKAASDLSRARPR